MKTNQTENTKGSVIKVDGMTCGGCARSVERVLKSVEGVREVRVDLEAHEAHVDHDGASISAMREAILGAGYRLRD